MGTFPITIGASAFNDHLHGGLPEVSQFPVQPGLPNPLLMLDGRHIVTAEQWYGERRPELKRLFQHYMYGQLPAPETVIGRIEREDPGAFDGRATLKEVTLTFDQVDLSPIQLLVIVPNERRAPAPVVLALNYFGNHTLVSDPGVRLSSQWMPERGQGVVDHRATEASRGTWKDIWSIDYVVERGYGVATFYNGDVDPDRPDKRGIQDHLASPDPRAVCGTIAAWAWGLSRAVDYLVTDPDIDRRRIIVTGHSRLGKAALLAGAFDERIALIIPHQAGCGGSAPSRSTIQPPHQEARRQPAVKPPETVGQLNEAFPHWFTARFKEFNDQPERLPFDQHSLVALCAPRPVLFTNGRGDTWINPGGQFEVLRAAAPVYRLLNAGDFDITDLPPDGQLTDSKLSYFLRAGGHSLLQEDWKAFLDFADAQLGRPAEHEAGQVIVPRWDMHEFELRGESDGVNPFVDAAVTGEFTSPSGRNLVVGGFYDGEEVWRLRFVPDEEGEWRYEIRGNGVAIASEGRLRCVAPGDHGFLRAHPENPHAFAYADGTPFLPMGDTCYGLHDDSHITPALRTEYLETRRRQRFNYVRMSVGHSESRAAADPGFWAWGGTPEAPDLDRLNPVFFRSLDRLFRELQSHGMNVELILLNFYRRPFTDPSLWTPARERLWLRYLVTRYGAFNNLFLWTLANEYETRPDGRYRLDQPEDVDWARATARFIKDHDPYRHPVTVHPVISSTTRGVSPRDPFDPPWRIGGFYGDTDAVDVLSQQTGQSGEGIRWNEQLQCWVGDAHDLVESVRVDRVHGKPVINSESGYEYLRGHPTEKRQVHHTDKVRHSAWRILCAGGYFAAGFHGTIGHADIWNRIDAPNRYGFTVRDEGAADQLAVLHNFFSVLPFWRMQPVEAIHGDGAVAIAAPGEACVVYLPRGGRVALDLGATARSWKACWFNPREGGPAAWFSVSGGEPVDVTAPDENDWVLLIRS